MTRFKTLLLAATFAAAVSFAGAAEDLSALPARAEGGEAKAQLDLAIPHRDGKGVEKDHARAIQRAHRAADQGHADAMDFVGHAFLRGSAIREAAGDFFSRLWPS